MTTAELVASARQGNLDAFNQLVLIYQHMVYTLVLWICNDENSAGQITQLIFLRAYQRIRQLRAVSFRIWLLRLARNTCLDELRRQKRTANELPRRLEPRGENDETTTWLADSRSSHLSIEEQFLSRILHGWIQDFQDQYSHALVLVDILDLDYTEAAAILNLPITKIQSRVSTARLALRSHLLRFYHHQLQQFNESLVLGPNE